MEALDLFIRMYGYPALFGGMVLEQFVPPMPGEPLLLGAGALAGNGRLSLWFAAALALAGTVVGDLVWYEIGRIGGQRVLKWMCRLAIEPDTCVRNGAETLTSHGASALLIAKFVPGLNSIGQPLAGALGMPRRRFMMFDALGAVLWVGLYVGLGFAFHDQLAEAVLLADRLGGRALVIVAVAFGLYLGIKVIRRQLFLREAYRADQPRGARGQGPRKRARVHRRSPPRARDRGPAHDDSGSHAHHARCARARPHHDSTRSRGGALLLLTERSHERPGGAPPT